MHNNPFICLDPQEIEICSAIVTIKNVTFRDIKLTKLLPAVKN